jgi:hypothetical protein
MVERDETDGSACHISFLLLLQQITQTQNNTNLLRYNSRDQKSKEGHLALVSSC